MAKITKRTWASSSGEKREAWVFDYVDQHGKRAKRQFAKKRDAEAFRLEIEPQINKGVYRAEAAKVTVADACDAYLKKLKAEADRNAVTEHYYRTTLAQLYNYVAPEADKAKERYAALGEKNRVSFASGIGGIKLSMCTRKVVNQFRDDLRAASIGVVTTRRILGSLSRALANAVDDEVIASNPAENIEVKSARDESDSKEVSPPSKDHLAFAIKLATGGLAVRIRLSASTGIRASELYELRWGDVHFNQGVLAVRRRVDAQGKVSTTKSNAGKRDVPLSSQILAELRAWREKAVNTEAGDLIFPNARGNAMDHRNMLEREFNPLMEMALKKATEDKVKFKPFTWHSLRHFAISTWIKAGGMQPKEVQTIAGHSSLKVTYDRYGHMFPSDSHRDIMDKIAADIFV